MRTVIAPDSFKGSLTAHEAALTMAAAAKKEWPELECDLLPMADGGEGTTEQLIAATNGQRIPVTVTGPLGQPVNTYFGVLGDGKTAALEVATVAGLTMIPPALRDPMQTTTLGLGELIRIVLDQGYRDFIVGLGGSATNDGGIGFLSALGVRFFDENEVIVPPNGAGLCQLHKVDFTALDSRLRECTIQVASDVNNPLYGDNGATLVFGPQKGATPHNALLLDTAMARYATLIEKSLGQPLHNLPGAGAAGGLGFALLSIGASIRSGAELIGTASNLEQRLVNTHFVITGEGQSDRQTLQGKVPFYVATTATKYGIPTILLSGSLSDDYAALYEHFASLHSIITSPMPLTTAMADAKPLLYDAARNVFRLLKLTFHKTSLRL